MALVYLTGKAAAVKARVLSELQAAYAQSEGALYLIVPAQYTLQAELETMRALNLSGSFRLHVLSPERLCTRIFDQAGRPRPVRIDEQGRVMLMQRAASARGERLKWYRGAVERSGFAERAVAQIKQFKQCGQTPDDVRELAGRREGALADKLNDLALLYDAYEQALAGRFLDGDDEINCAIERMADAPFLRGSQCWIFGFDLLSPALSRMVLALNRHAARVGVALVLSNDAEARDAGAYLPAQRSFDRLRRMADAEGAQQSRVRLEDVQGAGVQADIAHLERELYAYPARPYEGRTTSVQLAALANPQEEAEFAAALARQLVRSRGWRYRDVAVACQTMDEGYASAIERAFALYEVPVFLSGSRPADRHPLAIALLSALRLVTRGWRPEDMALYVRSGFAPIEDDMADRLMNYAAEHGLRGKGWQRPLTRGDAQTAALLEPVRAALCGPLQTLSERAHAAQDTDARLRAVFEFLEETGVYARLEAQRERLEEEGRRQWAMEGAQVWNRIVGALDQIHELMGDVRLSLRAMHDLLRRSLAATQVKALPQSPDAVMGGSLDHMKSRPVRALLVLGASDSVPPGGEGLLDDEELDELEREDGLWLGLSGLDRVRMARLGLKGALAFVSDYLFVSRPMSDMQGTALKPGALAVQLKRLLPDLKERGGVTGDLAMDRLRLGAPDGALCRLPRMLRAQPDHPDANGALRLLLQMPDRRETVEKLLRSLGHRVESAPLGRDLAARVGGAPDTVSASRLERFAACPFQDFVHYALRPEENKIFDLSPRDVGSFYHRAIETFARDCAAQLPDMSDQQAMERMDQTTAALLDELESRTAGESAVRLHQCRQLCEVARRAAATMARHLSGSRFIPCALEMEFGREGARIALHGGSALGGRIDRVDQWADADQRYVRVIDYKTGGKAVSLPELYYGLQLQLAIYLAAALHHTQGRPAGVFYFKIDDPVVPTELRDPAAVEALRQQKLRLDGLLVKDERIVRAMAAEPEHTLPVSFRKDGALSSSERLVAENDFHALIDHALRCADRALAAMSEGCTDISPARLKQRDACAFCDYRAVCQWEEGLPGAQPRTLPNLSAAEALACIREAQDGER